MKKQKSEVGQTFSPSCVKADVLTIPKFEQITGVDVHG